MMEDVSSLIARADRGDARAQYVIGRALLIGRDLPRDPHRGMLMIKAACTQQYSQALLLHSTLAARGLGRPQSWDDAVDLLAQAAATGDERARGQLAALGGVGAFDPRSWFAPSPVVQHCAAPRIYTIENFLPRPACEWLIAQSRNRLLDARVKSPTQGVPVVDSAIRSNSGAGFSALEGDLVVQLTCLRIASAIGVPIDWQEPTNVLHYAIGQEYRPHYDFVAADAEAAFAGELAQLGQRVCTMLVYLNDAYEGGETEFTRLGWKYKGKAGDALLFWNLSISGERERNSLHAGLPVTKGEKWLLSKWVRGKPVPLI